MPKEKNSKKNRGVALSAELERLLHLPDYFKNTPYVRWSVTGYDKINIKTFPENHHTRRTSHQQLKTDVELLIGKLTVKCHQTAANRLKASLGGGGAPLNKQFWENQAGALARITATREANADVLEEVVRNDAILANIPGYTPEASPNDESEEEVFVTPNKAQLLLDVDIPDRPFTVLRLTKMKMQVDSIMTKPVLDFLEAVLIPEKSYQQFLGRLIREGENLQTESDRLFFEYASPVLIDFVSMMRSKERSICERKFTVERVAPIFKGLQHTFGVVDLQWCEKQAVSTKTVQYGSGEYSITNMDILGTTDGNEVLFGEISGASDAHGWHQHAVEDSEKVVRAAVNGLRARLGNVQEASAATARNLKSLAIQIIGRRATLLAISLRGRMHFSVQEIATCQFPLVTADIDMFYDVFLLIATIISQIEDGDRIMRILRKEHRGKEEENVRKWLA